MGFEAEVLQAYCHSHHPTNSIKALKAHTTALQHCSIAFKTSAHWMVE